MSIRFEHQKTGTTIWYEVETFTDNQREKATNEMKNYIALNSGYGRIKDRFNNLLAVYPT